MVNCLLCAWWGSGILAVYLYQRNEPAQLLKPERALLGAMLA
jgi:hypothetical protein